MSVTDNIAKIEERIQKACRKTGRKREEITLMCVSKFVPITLIEEAHKAGIRDFGESRVQETVQKFEKRSKDFKLHMIGSLQRNKAKTAAALFDSIQSIDRPELITELSKYVQNKEPPLEILLELHTGEESKSGFPDLDSLFKASEMCLNVPGLKIKGLMTMAPFFGDMSKKEAVQKVRESFRMLAAAQKELENRFPSNNRIEWNCLSMGMSNDFEIAIEEGSTMLRIGSLIFK